MPAEERLVGPRLKLARAREHADALVAELGAFLATGPYRYSAVVDPKTRKPVYSVTHVTAVPLHISLIIGDALNNLRGALDHLAQQIFLVANPGTHVARHIQFPIYTAATQYAKDAPSKMDGMRDDAKKFIETKQPYHGPQNLFLAQLSSLTNLDKHRLLIAAGGGHFAADIGASISQSNEEFFGKGMPKFSLILRMQDNMCPLKIGDVLYTGAPDEKPNPDVVRQFFCVSLNEPKFVPAQPVEELLAEIIGGVERVLLESVPYLT